MSGGSSGLSNDMVSLWKPVQGALGLTPPATGPGVPSSLPNLGITPKYYNPNSFTPASTAGGPWNAMAQQLAGPMYKPTLMPSSTPMMKRPDPSKGGGFAAPGIAALLAHFKGMQ